jgi:aldehyde oxidoreductase
MSRFMLNGSAVEVSDRHPYLLAALRDELGVTSPKDGCAPSGQCGCCVVLVDGKPQVSCVMTLDKAEGRNILTLEGLEPDERERLATAFATAGALQCGFCTPGIVMAARDLLARVPDPSDADIREGLAGNLCRCTGYGKIVDAVERAARELRA